MTRQTDDADVVGKIFAAKLGAETNLVGFFQQLLLQLHVAEGTPCLVASRRQIVVVVRRGQFDGQQVLFGRSTADDESNVIGRTSGRAQRLHLLHQEGHQRTRVLDTGFRLLIEISLVGRASAFHHAKELVLVAFRSLDVNLGRQVATGVDFFVHGERCVLRVAQVLFRVGLVDTFRQSLFVTETGPDLLAFFTVDDSRAGVLAERELAFAGHLGIAKEGQGHVLVVFTGFGVGQNLSHLFVVRTA